MFILQNREIVILPTLVIAIGNFSSEFEHEIVPS